MFRDTVLVKLFQRYFHYSMGTIVEVFQDIIELFKRIGKKSSDIGSKNVDISGIYSRRMPAIPLGRKGPLENLYTKWGSKRTSMHLNSKTTGFPRINTRRKELQIVYKNIFGTNICQKYLKDPMAELVVDF